MITNITNKTAQCDECDVVILLFFTTNVEYCDCFTVCCPKGTYGDQCEACPGGTERPCWGNGDCEVCFALDYYTLLSLCQGLCLVNIPGLYHMHFVQKCVLYENVSSAVLQTTFIIARKVFRLAKAVLKCIKFGTT